MRGEWIDVMGMDKCMCHVCSTLPCLHDKKCTVE